MYIFRRRSAGIGAAYLALAVLVGVLGLSCELSPTLLSDSERSSLYTISFSVDGRPLSEGAVLPAGSSIVPTLSKMTDAEEPASLSLSVAGADGAALSALQLSTSAQAAAALTPRAALVDGSPQGAALVQRLDGNLPALRLPAELQAGAYELSATVSSTEGKSLQRSNMLLFIGTSSPSLDSVLAYPPSVEPGASILLAAMITQANAAAGSDPWIKWSSGGSVFSQGLLSAGFDRVVWTAPRSEGAFAVSVDVYPAAPPDASGFGFRATARQDLRAMVRTPAGGSTDEFADPLDFYSLFRFSGSFDDSGTRARSAQAQPIGQPQLDVYAGGFGYRFGPASGLSIPDLLPPVADGRMLPCVLLFRIAPQSLDGRIMRFDAEDGSTALELGLHDGRPYLAARAGSRVERSTAAQALEKAPVTLAAVLTPDGDRLDVLWFANGERIEAPTVGLPDLPQRGRSVIGGAGALAGVYDDIGVMSRAYPPALFNIEQRRRWHGDLSVAEGFEGAAAPAASTSSGPVTFGAHGAELAPASSLALGTSLRLDRPLLFEVEFSGPPEAVSLDLLGSDGGRRASITGSGRVLDAGGNRLMTLAFSPGHIRFRLAFSAGRLTISGDSGSQSGPITGPATGSAAGPFSLSLRNVSSADRLVLLHLSARTAGAAPAQ